MDRAHQQQAVVQSVLIDRPGSSLGHMSCHLSGGTDSATIDTNPRRVVRAVVGSSLSIIIETMAVENLTRSHKDLQSFFLMKLTRPTVQHCIRSSIMSWCPMLGAFYQACSIMLAHKVFNFQWDRINLATMHVPQSLYWFVRSGMPHCPSCYFTHTHKHKAIGQGRGKGKKATGAKAAKHPSFHWKERSRLSCKLGLQWFLSKGKKGARPPFFPFANQTRKVRWSLGASYRQRSLLTIAQTCFLKQHSTRTFTFN
jgi:hypothetical protein